MTRRAAGGPIGRRLRWRLGGFVPRRRVRRFMCSTPSAACSTCRTTRAWTPRRLRSRLDPGRRPKRGPKLTSGLGGLRPRRRLNRRARTVSVRTGQAPGLTRPASARQEAYSIPHSPLDFGPPPSCYTPAQSAGRKREAPGGIAARQNGGLLGVAGFRSRCDGAGTGAFRVDVHAHVVWWPWWLFSGVVRCSLGAAL